MGFRILDASNTTDRDLWTTLWGAWPCREVFANPAYVELFSRETDRALCAVWARSGSLILYPLLLRDLAIEAFSAVEPGEMTDITSPYGYGGAFASGDLSPEDACEFWTRLSEWAENHNVVSEFVRLSLFTESRLPYPGQTVLVGQNVVRTLDEDSDFLWMDVEHKVRKNVRKARRSGVTIEVDTDGARLDDFLEIYYATMDRRSAAPAYYFPRGFFERLCESLRGNYVFFHAVLDDAIVSTELVLNSADTIYSFLGGTEPSAFSVRPNDLLKYTIIEWAREQGKRQFVLGGGYVADDGIFRYKRSFAPNGVLPFSVGHRVLDAELYEKAVGDRKAMEERTGNATWEPQSGYFPAYRG